MMVCKMRLIFCIIISILPLFTLAANNPEYHTTLEAERAILTCASGDQLPVWSWYGKADSLATTLATGANKHKRFSNER